MANYYTDHPEIGFHLNHPLMKRIVDLKERNYEDKDKYEDAPVNYEDAIENYKRILEITGDVAANIIEPNMPAKLTRISTRLAKLAFGVFPCLAVMAA